ncbi:MAG: hypothetical protein LUC87_07155 [Clostridiales bacterium]|nr:hypothetical protein [Clostridiales bacterium]
MNNIKKIVCLTRNYPTGQMIFGVRLVYDYPISVVGGLSAAYQVENRKITGASVQGCIVTLTLCLDDIAASVIPHLSSNQHHDDKPKSNAESLATHEQKSYPSHHKSLLPRVVRVCQVKDIVTADGTIIPADGRWVSSDEAEEPVISQFHQIKYQNIWYNLYVPESYDARKRYPLVLFIHDVGSCGTDSQTTLAQGNGAITWATHEWQAKHPCIVLAPQITTRKDKSVEFIKGLVDSVLANYSIDQKRIYATGQSMGCMTICEMCVHYPTYFAACLLVAGQWDAEAMAESCTGCKFWILVSNHDERAFPGMNAITQAMEEKGVRIGRYCWDAKLPSDVLTKFAKDAMMEDVDIRYTFFDESSVVPIGKEANFLSNHRFTWSVAYEIEGVKEWLFSCVAE